MGTKKKDAMNFACSSTIPCTSPSFWSAKKRGMRARTTMASRFAFTRCFWLAFGRMNFPYRS